MVFFYLTPLIPLSFKGEGEGFGKRGSAPLEHPVYTTIIFQIWKQQ